MNMLIGLGLGLVLFLCTIKSYAVGLKHGKQLSQGNTPNVNLNPVKTFKDYLDTKEETKQTKARKKEADLAYEGWHGKKGIMNFNPYDEEEGE